MLQCSIKQIKTNINKYILHVLSIKLRYSVQGIFHLQYQSQVSPILLYVRYKSRVTFIRRSFRDVFPSIQGLNIRIDRSG